MRQEAKLVRIDESKPHLREWYTQGFRACRLKLHDVSCRVCRSLKDAEFYIWNLLNKDNPLYRLTHPNCECGLIPIKESNIKHEEFDKKNGYEVKLQKLRKIEDKKKKDEKQRQKDQKLEEQELEQKKKEVIKKDDKSEPEDIKNNDKLKDLQQDIKDTEQKIKETRQEAIKEKDTETKREIEQEEGILQRYLNKVKRFMRSLVRKNRWQAHMTRRGSPLYRD